MRTLLFSILLVTSFVGKTQEDTIRIMQYNLLNYGNYTSYCTTTNNNIDAKDEYLRTILNYVKPDVFAVNELGYEAQGLDNKYGLRILDSTLNINGVTKYQKAQHTGGSYTVNMLYYNSEKLVFHKQEVISNGVHSGSLVRSIDFYTLYHNDPTLATHNDTVFMTFVVAHLKAGSTQSNQDERADAALDVMEYLDLNDGQRANRFMCGDFNVKGDTELGYSNFLTYSNTNVRFEDPLDEPGYWAGDWNFKHLHTQSTHDVSNNGDCPSGGGLDDRFDIVLASQHILWGVDGVSYIVNSYDAVGNDGTSYNSDLNTSTNTSVPPSVAIALFNMSDHLPVVLDVRVSKDVVNGIYQPAIENLNVEFNNPIQSQLVVRIPNDVRIEYIELYDINGRLVYTAANSEVTQFVIETESLNTGLYFLKIQSLEGKQGNYRVVKL
ncbi:MAG: T9SS type A sorting domain-containing protein [Flavobacteriales bacterium]|nr:T9SS type A sorting domain-containing protein [Flavobacteriales bacterium]